MESVLIANRGEIAVRVIRAARDMGMRSIAVYSDLDRDALHARLADEAWSIGGAPAAESYLNVEAILDVAARSGAEAVHPGYGFLAENAGFARRVVEAGLAWVGPPPEAIATMGDKIASRRAAAAAGVPGVPGTLEPVRRAADLRAVADAYGLPVVVKAAHGGGGRGLRVVRRVEDLDRSFEAARREADAYFANPEVYVERYLEGPRHVEAQVLCDRHGNAVFLGERDCSLQRRHQKLVEEAPSPAVSARQRRDIGKAAVAVARAAHYESAGTVEFLLDADGTFYFLEMNTRLQVEHAVTEAVTGIDLVKEQLRLAAGERLAIGEAPARGHAIEFRINAEDPGRGFRPQPGRITEYHEPGGPGVRVDSGYEAGSTISQYYDNLIAKLIVWGADRDEALARARRALGEFRIAGVPTTLPFHRLILDLPAFREGTHDTRTVESALDLSALAQPEPEPPADGGTAGRTMTVEVGGRRFEVRLWAPEGPGADGPRRPPARRRAPAPTAVDLGEPEGLITAPMQGTIVKVHHRAGEAVEAGEPLFVLEAMKMENELRAPAAGQIIDLRVRAGDLVSAGQVLAIVR
ncbi:MAG: acetyl-CoA carboxylase biotin carboxylase subunit [Acidimicrobiia bacterium]|nr:acetyl-CoA carboxylase biotin carboxylase subunit [Acidimicrobiia bacterium]